MKEQKIKLVLKSKEKNPELKDLAAFLNQIAKSYETFLATLEANKSGKPLKEVHLLKDLGKCKVVSIGKNSPIIIELSFALNIDIQNAHELIPYLLLAFGGALIKIKNFNINIFIAKAGVADPQIKKTFKNHFKYVMKKVLDGNITAKEIESDGKVIDQSDVEKFFEK